MKRAFCFLEVALYIRMHFLGDQSYRVRLAGMAAFQVRQLLLVPHMLVASRLETRALGPVYLDISNPPSLNNGTSIVWYWGNVFYSSNFNSAV